MSAIDSSDIASRADRQVGRRYGNLVGALTLAIFFSACGSIVAMGDPWPLFSLLLLITGIALAARKPLVATVILLATYPMLDLTPWAGQWAMRHHDYLVLGVCSGYWIYRDRNEIAWPNVKAIRFQLVIAWLLWILIATALGYVFLAKHGVPGAIVQLSPANAFRVAKGVLLAGAVAISYPFHRAPLNDRRSLARVMSWGASVALIYIGIWCVIERSLFFDWTSWNPSYRVAGPMSGASNVGGQAFEVTVILLMALTASGWRDRLDRDFPLTGQVQKTLVIVGLLAGTVAILLTLTRSAIATLAAATLVTVILGTLRADRAKRRRRLIAAGLAVGTVLMIGVVSLPALRQRLQQIPSAWQTRLALYRTSIRAAAASDHDVLWGTGCGTFPTVYTHFQSSRHPPSAPGFFATRQIDKGTFLVARGGAPCYLGTQIDRATAVQAERVRLLVRSRAPVGVTVYLCEKNLFTSVACRSARLKIPAEKTIEYGKWRWIDARINGVEKDNESKSINRRSLRPLNLSIGNPPGGYEIAIAGIQLVGSKNEILWQDGGFDRGARSWLMTTDHYHPFHVENLYLHLWIEQGSIGLLFIFLVSSVAIGTLWQQQSKGSAPLIAFVLTMLIAGLVNSPIDTPEATFIWAAVIFAVLIPDSSSQRPPISSSSVPAHHFDQSPRRRRRAVAVPSRRRQPIR